MSGSGQSDLLARAWISQALPLQDEAADLVFYLLLPIFTVDLGPLCVYGRLCDGSS